MKNQEVVDSFLSGCAHLNSGPPAACGYPDSFLRVFCSDWGSPHHTDERVRQPFGVEGSGRESWSPNSTR